MTKNINNNIPIYQQVKLYILKLINDDTWQKDRKLPSEHELVKILSASRMTINRALRELANEGYINRVAGVGSFAAEAKPASHPLEIRNIAEEIVARGHTHSCKVIKIGEARATPEVAIQFAIAPGSRLFHSQVLHFESDRAIQFEDRFVLPTFAPDYLKIEFDKTTTNEYLLKVSPSIEKVEQTIAAEQSSEELKKLLVLSEHEPSLILTRKTWVNNEVVTFSRLYHPAFNFQFSSHYKP
jgi:GntR family histidine utilization transcriptional repressor